MAEHLKKTRPKKALSFGKYNPLTSFRAVFGANLTPFALVLVWFFNKKEPLNTFRCIFSTFQHLHLLKIALSIFLTRYAHAAFTAYISPFQVFHRGQMIALFWLINDDCPNIFLFIWRWIRHLHFCAMKTILGIFQFLVIQRLMGNANWP